MPSDEPAVAGTPAPAYETGGPAVESAEAAWAAYQARCPSLYEILERHPQAASWLALVDEDDEARSWLERYSKNVTVFVASNDAVEAALATSGLSSATLSSYVSAYTSTLAGTQFVLGDALTGSQLISIPSLETASGVWISVTESQGKLTVTSPSGSVGVVTANAISQCGYVIHTVDGLIMP